MATSRSPVAARAHHRLDRVAAVAPDRMHVEVAADVLPVSRRGSSPRSAAAISSSPLRISAGIDGRSSAA